MNGTPDASPAPACGRAGEVDRSRRGAMLVDVTEHRPDGGVRFHFGVSLDGYVANLQDRKEILTKLAQGLRPPEVRRGEVRFRFTLPPRPLSQRAP